MNIMALIGALPGAAQGLIWGIMAIGVYITFRTLDIADLTVDGTMCNRRCCLHYDDDGRIQCMGCYAGSFCGWYAGRSGNRLFHDLWELAILSVF